MCACLCHPGAGSVAGVGGVGGAGAIPGLIPGGGKSNIVPSYLGLESGEWSLYCTTLLNSMCQGNGVAYVNTDL